MRAPSLTVFVLEHPVVNIDYLPIDLLLISIENKATAAIEMHYIDLSKCRKRDNFSIEDALDRWVKYFIDPEYIKTLSMNTQYNYPNLKKAVELLDESNYTEGQLVEYDRYLDNIRSWNTTMKSSFNKGRNEERQLILRIINDLREKISVDEISTKYGVEVSFVEQFIKD